MTDYLTHTGITKKKKNDGVKVWSDQDVDQLGTVITGESTKQYNYLEKDMAGSIKHTPSF